MPGTAQGGGSRVHTIEAGLELAVTKSPLRAPFMGVLKGGGLTGVLLGCLAIPAPKDVPGDAMSIGARGGLGAVVGTCKGGGLEKTLGPAGLDAGASSQRLAGIGGGGGLGERTSTSVVSRNGLDVGVVDHARGEPGAGGGAHGQKGVMERVDS